MDYEYLQFINVMSIFDKIVQNTSSTKFRRLEQAMG